MNIEVTVLCENSVFNRVGAIAEHGWSVFIQTDYGNYLFDTGQGLALINNARVLRKDLTSIKGIVLSHHHFDHTGGLLDVLALTSFRPVYAHPDLFKESFSLGKKYPRYIGIPFPRVALETKGAEFIFNRDFQEVFPGAYLTGEVPRITDFEVGDKNQVIKTPEGFVKDPLLDDQSLVFETPKGLFIILGCAHAGIINTLSHIIKKTGQTKINTLIGGTHLGSLSEKQREKSIQALQEFDIERIGVSHCTGMKPSMELASIYKERFFFCNVGTIIGNN